MKKRVKGTIVAAAMAIGLFTSSVHADTTPNAIGKIQLTTAGAAYFTTQSGAGWGASGCPNAVYVSIDKGSTPVFDNLIALAITSRLNAANVVFYGTCYGDGTYFAASYMLLLN